MPGVNPNTNTAYSSGPSTKRSMSTPLQQTTPGTSTALYAPVQRTPTSSSNGTTPTDSNKQMIGTDSPSGNRKHKLIKGKRGLWLALSGKTKKELRNKARFWY